MPKSGVSETVFNNVQRFLSEQGNREAIMAELINEGAVLHARYDGRSFDIPLSDLDVGPDSDDRQIKRAFARHLEIPEAKLRD